MPVGVFEKFRTESCCDKLGNARLLVDHARHRLSEQNSTDEVQSLDIRANASMQIEQKYKLTYSRRREQRQPELKCSGKLIILISNLFFNLVEEIEGRGVTPLDGEDESKRHKGLLSS